MTGTGKMIMAIMVVILMIMMNMAVIKMAITRAMIIMMITKTTVVMMIKPHMGTATMIMIMRNQMSWRPKINCHHLQIP